MSSGLGVKLNWRKYGFFDKKVLSENVKSILSDENPLVLKADGGNIFIGDSDGNLYQLDKNLNIISKSKIYRRQLLGLTYIVNISVILIFCFKN